MHLYRHFALFIVMFLLVIQVLSASAMVNTQEINLFLNAPLKHLQTNCTVLFVVMFRHDTFQRLSVHENK